MTDRLTDALSNVKLRSTPNVPLRALSLDPRSVGFTKTMKNRRHYEPPMAIPDGQADMVIGSINAMLSETEPLSEGTLLGYITAIPSLYVPRLLQLAWQTNRVSKDQLTRYLSVAWSRAEYPQDVLADSEWFDMFNAVGYTSNGTPTEPPTVMRLYRGAPTHTRHRWAWTDSSDVARTFAHHPLRLPGRLWTVEAPASAFLMHATQLDFDEYVIRADLLDVHEMAGSSASYAKP